MTLYTNDYLEYYLTLVGWIINNGIWDMISDTGLFALPFIIIVAREWIKVRGEGADEGNKGCCPWLALKPSCTLGMWLFHCVLCQPSPWDLTLCSSTRREGSSARY